MNEQLQTALLTASRIQRELLDVLRHEYVGKDEVIDLLGICLVAGENLFLLGPPGTAKSALVRSLAARLQGRVFDYLLTRFTEPSELFGPFDIRRLREGDLLTNTEGMLPEADVIFLDELLNANSAILNSLLMALNERIFRRGRETRRLNYVLTVGASNRLPEDDTLGALFDRFLLRVRSDNVPPEMLTTVLEAGWQLQRAEAASGDSVQPITMDELRVMQSRIPLIELGPSREIYAGLISRLRHAGLAISDRRAIRLQRLLAASAMMCQRMTVEVSDFWVLRYIWDTLEQVEVLAKIVNDVLRSPTGTVSAGTSVHPRAVSTDAPNPEHLGRDLDQIEAQLGSAGSDVQQKSWLRDRLSLLAARVEWVQPTEARDFLRGRIQSLMTRLGR